MDRAIFFKDAKVRLFNGKLKQDQVEGMDAILTACADLNVTDLRHIASILATPMIETGGTFIPTTESLNYNSTALRAKFPSRITKAEAERYGRVAGKHAADQVAIANIIYGGTWGKSNLGNTEAGDGYRYRGRGLCQITGRTNYTKFSRLLGVDLIKDPELACDIRIAAKILVIGERDGLFTGAKLSDFFNASKTDWRNARKIINGLDEADKLASDSQQFHLALKAAA